MQKFFLTKTRQAPNPEIFSVQSCGVYRREKRREKRVCVRSVEGSSDMDAPGIEPGSASVSCECYETSNPIRALGIQV